MGVKSNIGFFKKQITGVLGKEQVCSQYIDRYAKGTDAGFYRLVPQLVVLVNSEWELQEVIKAASSHFVAITFKAGGTSLSGQTITDSVLVEIGPEFSQLNILDEGKRIKVQPGVRGGFANAQLARYGYKIGPSPASINSAKIGGIVANNASGASYGIITNSYNTIEAMRIVMADGTLLVTDDKASCKNFQETHKELLDELLCIKQQLENDPTVYAKIQSKYQLKNTTGYGMNAFVDFDDPIDILMHLMVGSEGTLGFISEVTMRTIPDEAHKSCALIFLPNIQEAAKCIIPLRSCCVSAAELMDRNALRAVENVDGLPSELKELPDGAAALLVETAATSGEDLKGRQEEILAKLSGLQTLFPISFTDNAKDYNTFWKVRKGLFTSAAATRPSGATCIIEDVAFPGEVLAEALPALQKLLDKHHYSGSVMWGHLLDGNIHFLVMPDFDQDWQMDNYKLFMHALVKLVVHQFNGSLKAEHGTGRNMAPFVEFEWGQEVYELMKRVKRAIDPLNILNPGVLINDDPEVYAKNIKQLPQSHPLVDACIECGFCESSCPSRDLTLTPRQRIAVYRALNANVSEISGKDLKALAKAFEYKGEESCATDGLCALNCPVGINTGKLIKDLRFESKSRLSNAVATYIANHYGGTSAVVKGALSAVGVLQKILQSAVMEKGGHFVHNVSGRNVPLWNRYMPHAAARVDVVSDVKSDHKVVYFPACINRMMGNDASMKDKDSLTKVTKRLLNKAGYEIIYPENLSGLCCGMSFDSKGFRGQGMMKLKELEDALLEASDYGRYPVLCDMSPCLLRMKELMDARLELYEPIEFTLSFLKDKLQFTPQNETVMVHVTCSSTKMGLDEQLVQLAQLCAKEVIKPEKTGCCGWAGDKGFNLPELNKSALRYLKEEVPERAVAGYSTSRTCEVGLSVHTGLTYQSILYLVDKATENLTQNR
ncbi:FAD-binding oxidoreductase [Carboxylicivirga sediminis]|uniref:D-lactate dehydrogenase (cytochrome) n=1 Tax=Carboxylicivirga sediminis TaxID=2006564 RepID=A0A941F259_9BACT|nr:FAD-binding and (Fe-S)-binding domain-containing protein [Carboxylicivirga sediminis]MBR8533990.1 FAD-binding oxidoreductase [Carboxylicivirga sediminis]